MTVSTSRPSLSAGATDTATKDDQQNAVTADDSSTGQRSSNSPATLADPGSKAPGRETNLTSSTLTSTPVTNKNEKTPREHEPRCQCGCVPNILSLIEMASLRKQHREREQQKKEEQKQQKEMT